MTYSANGKQILNGDLHYGDAVDANSANAIVAALNSMSKPFDYVGEAMQTCSPAWHGEMVSRFAFVIALNDSINSANRLDKVKKTLFYGKDNGLNAGLRYENIFGLPSMFGNMPIEQATNLIHGIIGVFTEAGELLEAMRDAITNGKAFDTVNLMEESGDLFWYIAIIANACGFTFDQAMQTNIAKLRARYPDRFTEYDANNRNLVVERGILETRPHDVAEQALPAHYRTAKMEGERNQDGDAIEAQKPR